MRVLVTGGAGFIGSHIVVELLEKDHQVIVIDNLCNSKIEAVDRIKRITNKNFDFIKHDICDRNFIDSFFSTTSIDAIIHLAALKSGADSIKNPALYYKNNIESTRILVDMMKKYKIKKMVFSSSATVYGNSDNVPIKETEKIGDVISPYGMTKYLSELYLKNQAEQHKDFKIVALRYFNPIGAHPSGLIGEDSPDDIPNNLMLYLLKVANGELPFLNIFGNDYCTKDGSGLRDFIHVTDLALSHIAALDYLERTEAYFDVFNVGTGRGYTVLELVSTFEEVNLIKIPYKFVSRRPGDVAVSFASVKKANTILDWQSKYNLRDCVKHSWEFYSKNKKGLRK